MVASSGGVVVGTCVVKPLDAGAYELMSIAIQPAHQKSSYGTMLMKRVIDFFCKSGASPRDSYQ
ncbi:GNAT family N-acetyltransferase [Desulfonatronum sp. SC1]|uniref:GNAT family N-acetyltransferase n=1 Tax=Desulfonatronum sp. SC1 TaxID=2109626 RepID=UPI000D31E40B|nr:hypothetical protein C6366_18315 [Desulfonatronum sp. SC1]